MATVLLMVGTEKGAFLLRSDRERREWELEGPHMPGWKVGEVQLDLRGAPRMFAAVSSYVYGPCIHVSDDLGKSWRQVEMGPAYPENHPNKLQQIWTIAPGADSEPNRVYAGVAEAGIFCSDDRGQTWRELPGLSGHETREEWIGGLGGLCCHTIRVHPASPARLWAAISAVGVFRSDDRGSTWQLKNNGLIIAAEAKTHKEIGSCVHRLVVDPENPQRLYQQNHRGVFRSDDGGDSWQQIENGLPSGFGFPMTMLPKPPHAIYIIPLKSDEYRFPQDGQLRVYCSRDRGDSWQPLHRGLPEQFYSGVLRQSMTNDGMEEAGIYFGTTGGQIYFSVNGGESWSEMPFWLPRITSLNAAILEG